MVKHDTRSRTQPP